jgi:hypothetical protein
MTTKIRSLVMEAVLEDGTVQRLEVEGHVHIETRATYEISSTPPYGRQARTITLTGLREDRITETVNGPEAAQRFKKEPSKYQVGDIVSLPGTHRFAGRPKTTPSYYRVKAVFWLEVNHRWGLTLETRDGLEIGTPDQSQMSVLTKVDRFPLRKGDFVKTGNRKLYKVADRSPECEGFFFLIRPDGSRTPLSVHESQLTVVPREKVKVVKTFEVAE